MATALKDPLVGRLVDTRYLVHDRIASGGMATVYLATDTRLERPVALKVMHTHLAADASFVARFTREARSAARLSHPGVVSVYDQGASDGTVYLAMEHIPGRTLRDLVAEAAPLPLGNALDLIEEVLDGLAAAHAAGLVHRDVKPENVLVGDDGRLRVADFGLARAATTATGGATSTLIGTVGYLAPELVLDGASDERADVYAAGVVLFELLTGRAPFAGGAPAQIAFRHVSQDLPVVSSMRPGVPPGVDALVAGATDRDPARRPRDAGVMLAQVRALSDSLPDAVLDAMPVVVAGGASPSAQVSSDSTRVHGREHVIALPVGELRDAAAPATTTTTTTTTTATRAEAREHERGSTRALPRPAGARPSGRGGPLGLPPDADEVAPPQGLRRPRRPRAVVLALVVVLLVVVLGAGSAAAWAYTAGPLARAVVPDVVGASAADAKSLLTNRELVADLTDAFNDSVPKGEVISTNPVAGDRVEKDSTVDVVVSTGPALRPVPDLLGKTEEQAKQLVTAAGLQVGDVRRDFSDEVPEGSVTSQQTPTQPPLGPGGKVSFTVSQGKQPVAAPALATRTEDDARKAITDAGLQVGDVTHQNDDHAPAGTVISSDPSTGNLTRGEKVSFVISDGPSQTVVPDVTGHSVDDATQILQQEGLQAYQEQHFWSDTVREQWPTAGTKVDPGSTVVIKIW